MGARPRFYALLCTLVAAAAIGWLAAPARAASTVTVTPADQGTQNGWYMRTISDPTASDGSAVRFDWNGSVTFRLNLPSDADTFTVRVRGDQCAGGPAFTVTIDNVPAASDTVTSSSWTTMSYSRFLLAGTHTFSVAYTNNFSQWYPACERVLYFDDVTFSASDSMHVPANPAVPAGFVHQSGTQLLDGTGQPLKLHGVDLGGWLMWEGWIWGSGLDYIGQSAMMSNLTSLVGPDAADQFRTDVYNNYITGSDFRAMGAYGLNVARVPFNYRLLEDDSNPFVYKQSGWDVLDRLVSEAKQNNVYLVLDMHAAPCSQMYSFVSDYVGPQFLWSTPQCQDRMVAMWKAIAARYANENIIAGYDLLGETVIGNQQLLALYQRVTAAIRQVDPNHLIIYEGNTLARDFTMFTTPLDSNEMLSCHDYPWMIPGQDFTARIPGYDAAAVRMNAPMWVGEFGQSVLSDIQRYVTTFNQDPLFAGWAQWTWKESPGFEALQTLQLTPAAQKLIGWMNNTLRPKPTLAEAQQGMADFINGIKFENTMPDPNMQAALGGVSAAATPLRIAMTADAGGTQAGTAATTADAGGTQAGTAAPGGAQARSAAASTAAATPPATPTATPPASATPVRPATSAAPARAAASTAAAPRLAFHPCPTPHSSVSSSSSRCKARSTACRSRRSGRSSGTRHLRRARRRQGSCRA